MGQDRLTGLRVQNFLRHKALSLEFDPHVTTIVGGTDTGKSAVVRALRFLCLNQPRGSGYVRHGSKTVRVTATFDSTKVARTKGRKNTYRVGGSEYKAVGSRVPEAVEAVLNVGSANFQRQDEPHFWLFDSPGQVAKHLNEIADLDTMDRVMANVAARVRRASAEVEVTRGRLKEAKQRAESLAWVPAMLAALARLERTESRCRANRVYLRSGASLIRQARSARSDAVRASGANVAAKTAVRSGAAALEMRETVRKWSAMVEKAEKLRGSRAPDPTKVYAARERADQFAERRREAEMIVRQGEEAWKAYKEATRTMTTLSAELARREKRLKRCPTCLRSYSSPPRTFTCPTKHRGPGRKKERSGTT
jgi:exonuclease SbcC